MRGSESRHDNAKTPARSMIVPRAIYKHSKYTVREDRWSRLMLPEGQRLAKVWMSDGNRSSRLR